MDIKNAEYTVEKTVVAEYLAKNVGSGDVSVFATPMMIAMMEEAAAAAVKPFLKEGQTTVGAF
ncbi:MAG: dihydrolipoamide acyltransferase, partial [Hydrogenoanaerobacterium sp.]